MLDEEVDQVLARALKSIPHHLYDHSFHSIESKLSQLGDGQLNPALDTVLVRNTLENLVDLFSRDAEVRRVERHHDLREFLMGQVDHLPWVDQSSEPLTGEIAALTETGELSQRRDDKLFTSDALQLSHQRLIAQIPAVLGVQVLSEHLHLTVFHRDTDLLKRLTEHFRFQVPVVSLVQRPEDWADSQTVLCLEPLSEDPQDVPDVGDRQ